MALERSMGDESPQRHRSVGVDAVETGDSVQAHDVLRAHLAPVYLDDQIRTAGKETAVGAEAGAQVDGLGHRGRLVILEAHRQTKPPLSPFGGEGRVRGRLLLGRGGIRLLEIRLAEAIEVRT